MDALFYSILASLTISALSPHMRFVVENLQSFVYSASRCTSFIPAQYFIVMQLVIFLPMVLIRNLVSLSTTALVADVFILAGLVYTFGREFGFIAERGIAKVELFNPKDFRLLIGTAAFPLKVYAWSFQTMTFPLSGAMIFLLGKFGRDSFGFGPTLGRMAKLPLERMYETVPAPDGSAAVHTMMPHLR